MLCDRIPAVAHLASQVLAWTGAALILAVVVVLAGRLRTAPVHGRRRLAQRYAYGIVAIVFLPVGARLFPQPGANVTLAAIQLGVLAGVPIACVLIVLEASGMSLGFAEA